MQKIIYSIQGNIGSGKTTLLKQLKKHLQSSILIINEPVQTWMQVGKYNLLQQYYKDSNRWAFSFQTFAVLTRMSQINTLLSLNLNKQSSLNTSKSQQQDPLDSQKFFFSERSINADRNIFAKLLHKTGRMNNMEYQMYESMFKLMLKLFKQDKILHHYIYLRTSPQICFSRIQNRARSGQNVIDLQYLSNIHELHQQWICKLEPHQSITLNGQAQFQKDQSKLKIMIKQVQSQLNI